MNKWILILTFAIALFFVGKFIYDNYGDDVRKYLNLPIIVTGSNPNAVQSQTKIGSNPNGEQSTSVNRGYNL